MRLETNLISFIVHAQRCRAGHGETTRSIRAKGRLRDAEGTPGGISKAPEGLSEHRRAAIKWGTTKSESRVMTVPNIRDVTCELGPLSAW